MPLNLNGPSTQEQLEQLETDGLDELAVSAEAIGHDVGARIELSRTRSRWSVAAFAEWWKGRGASAGAKASIKLGD